MLYQQLLCPLCKHPLQVKVEFVESVMPYKHYICNCGYALRTETYDPRKSMKDRIEELMQAK